MFFLEFSEMVVGLLFLIVCVSQVIIPIFRGTRLFPLFSKEQILRAKLEETKQKKLEDDLNAKIEKTKGGK